MARPCVYIDYHFFKLLLKKGNEQRNPLIRKDQMEYDMLMDFLFDSGIDLICHIDDDEPDEHDLIRVLEDFHVQGKIILQKFSQKAFNQELNGIGQRSPFSLCCLATPDKQIKDRISSSGFTCISKTNFDDFLQKPYFKQNSFEVAKDGDISGWHDFSKLSHTFNTIVIFDSYLFAKQPHKTRSGYAESISEIISKLLSNNECERVFVLITIPKLQPHQEVQESIDVLKNKLEDSLKRKLNDKKEVIIGLTRILQRRPINHDRLIFTNFMVLFSGDSFNYFQRGQVPAVETVLTSYSMLDWHNNFLTYLKKLKKLKKSIPGIDSVGTQKIRSGHCDIEFLKTI